MASLTFCRTLTLYLYLMFCRLFWSENILDVLINFLGLLVRHISQILRGFSYDIVISFIFSKGDFFIFLYDMHRLPILLFGVLYRLGLKIIIYKFPVARYIFKIPHLGSISISRFEDIYEVDLIHFFLTTIDIFHH